VFFQSVKVKRTKIIFGAENVKSAITDNINDIRKNISGSTDKKCFDTKFIL